MADPETPAGKKSKKKAKDDSDRDTFRFQISDADRALVAQASMKAGDESPRAFAHRAVVLAARRVMAELDPAEQQMMEAAFAALRSVMKKAGPGDIDESA